MSINYNNKVFVSRENTANGEVSSQTIFKYYQKGELVWADYSGGEIVKGHLIAKVDEAGCLDMIYHHINSSGVFKTGKCTSTPSIQANGKLLLKEKWQWTSGDLSEGESVIEEI